MIATTILTINILSFCALVFSVPISQRNNVVAPRTLIQGDDGRNPLLMESITAGTMMALEECQSLFKWDKWNCPKEDFGRHSKQSPNKETAFTKAIIAAGIVYSITRNCSTGDIPNCGCDPQFENSDTNMSNGYSTQAYEKTQASIPQQNVTTIHSNLLLKNNNNLTDFKWSWGGCSEDTNFASRVARDLLNNEDVGIGDAKKHVGVHNYNVGVQIVRHTMIKKCRCHGVSGSCSIQTCWLQTSSFQHIAKKLKEKYNRAARLSMDSINKAISMRNSIQKREEAVKPKIPASEHSLVYLEQSPDYCLANSTQDWPGTRGRSCSRSQLNTTTPAEKKSCKNLCRQCGHKVKKQIRTIKVRCNCKFNWCCSVQCDTCLETIEEYYCQ